MLNIDTDYLSNSEMEELGLPIEEICVTQLEQELLDEESDDFYRGETCRG